MSAGSEGRPRERRSRIPLAVDPHVRVRLAVDARIGASRLALRAWRPCSRGSGRWRRSCAPGTATPWWLSCSSPYPSWRSRLLTTSTSPGSRALPWSHACSPCSPVAGPRSLLRTPSPRCWSRPRPWEPHQNRSVFCLPSSLPPTPRPPSAWFGRWWARRRAFVRVSRSPSCAIPPTRRGISRRRCSFSSRSRWARASPCVVGPEPRPGPLWPRSGHGSRVSCTMWSRTA